VKKPSFLINETTWLRKEKNMVGFIYGNKRKNACGFV
jgi:hypothetical protein